LIFAQEMDLRARIARALQSNGFAAELASDAKGALSLALERNVDAAIVAPGSTLAGLGMVRQLRDAVPQMLVVAEGSDEMARLRDLLPEADAFLPKLCEEQLLTRLAEMLAVPAARDPAPVPTTLWIEGCRIDLAAYVFIDAEGRELPLTSAEHGLLKELASSPGCVMSLQGVAGIPSSAVLTCSWPGYGER
jgi:DNA-binding response OmpR family regulator